MALSNAQWDAIKDDRIADASDRLNALPLPYQQYVRRAAKARRIGALFVGADLGLGEVHVYDVLLARCEDEIKRRAEGAPEGDDVA